MCHHTGGECISRNVGGSRPVGEQEVSSAADHRAPHYTNREQLGRGYHYKDGWEGDTFMYNFEPGTKLVFQLMSLKCTDNKVRLKFTVWHKSLNQISEYF